MTQLFPNWMQNKTYSARLDRQVVKAMSTEGVISGLEVTQDTGANMLVRVAVGVAIIYGDDQVDQGAYLVTTTASETVTIAAAPGSNSRIDLIYYRVNDPNAGGPAGDNSAFGVVAGTPAVSPVMPALPTSAIPLASVLVTAGNVAVVNSMVTSLRDPAYDSFGNPPGAVNVWPGTEATIPAGWLPCYGQSVSKSTYWRLFAKIGSIYGSTSTNFTIPDYRGRIPVGLDNMGGVDAGVLNTANTLGLVGGAQLVALTIAELATHNHVISHTHPIDPPITAISASSSTSTNIIDPGHNHPVYISTAVGTSNFDLPKGNFSATLISGTNPLLNAATGITASSATSTTGTVDIAAFTSGANSADSATTGSGTAHNNMQPYIMQNYMIKV